MLQQDFLYYTEMFHSIQGEGKSIGKNVVFIRLSNCNLKCIYCDSKHSWTKGTKIKFSDIYKYYVDCKAQGIIITGGEPLVQKNVIEKMLKYDVYPYKYVEVETNGTINPGSKLFELVDQFNISPKLENSGNAKKDRYKPKVLKKIIEQSNDCIFKFVISDEKDLQEIEEIITENNINKKQVYLMCEGVDSESQLKNQQNIIQIALEKGWNFSPRAHILIWDKKQKV